MSFAISKDKGALFFRGAIDDHAQFDAMQPLTGNVTINMKQITSINSVGARNYLVFVSKTKSAKVTYEDCPHVLVDAFLMLPALLGPTENTAAISSLHVPFYCPRCKQDHELFVKTDELGCKGEKLTFPVRVCPSCAGILAVASHAEQLSELVELGALKVRG